MTCLVRPWACLAGVAALFLCAVLTSGTAAAERVRTTKATKVYKRTGEQSGVVTNIAKGKTLDVVAKQGRWLKVRVNGRTGWVTQSSVVSLEARDVPRNTRRRPFVDGRSRRRGWSGGAPEDRVGADAVDVDDGRDLDEDDDDDETGRARRASRDDDRGKAKGRGKSPARGKAKAKGSSRDRDDDDDDDDDWDDDEDDDGGDSLRRVTVTASRARVYPRMSKKARPVLTVRRGAQLVVLDEHESGKWIRVEDDEGAAGWIAADAVELDDGRPPRKARTIAATARLGFARVGGTFTSNGMAGVAGSPPPDYAFGSNAVSLAVGGELVMAYKRDFFVGAGLEYLGCMATPGIRYAEGMMAEDIGFKTHDVDVRLLGGYDFHKPNGMTAWARVGYHYGVFSVGNLNNLARLPAETFKGPTVGAALRIPRLSKQLGAEAAVDLVYPGSRRQTQGIEDGAVEKAMAASAELVGIYDWRPEWKLGAAYQLGYAATRWSGTSARISGATAAKRTDLSHVVTVGLGRAF